jgi:late competence protein required for DNA uptake (superfamily II DNA/RNA helicase)
MPNYVYVCHDCGQQHIYFVPGAELYCGSCIRQGRKVLLDRDYRAESANVNVENLRSGR